MPSLDQVLAPVRAVPPGDRALAARMLLRLERRLASAAAFLHPACRPKPGVETLDDQDRLLATWLAAYYAGVSATPDVLRGDLLEPLVARSGCAEPFVGPAASGGDADDGSALRFGVPSKPEARCDSRSELLRAAAAAIVALHAYLNYPRRGEEALPPDETAVALSTLVIKSLAPPSSPAPASSAAAASSDGGSGEAPAQQQREEAVRALDAELADLGLLPSCRSILASAGLALKSSSSPAAAAPAAAAAAAGAAAAAAGGDAPPKAPPTGAAAAAAADAELEADEAADATAAAAADAARAGETAAFAAAASADNSSSIAAHLPGVPSLAPGSCATSHAQLEAVPPLRTAHVRWLMHWARGRVLASMADVALAVDPDGDGPRRAPALLAAAQRDALGMVSALPAHPAGYSLFAALAMRGQQFTAAVPFLRRGLAVARAARDDAGTARMCPQLAAALLLGGGGKAPTDPSKPQPVAVGDVLALLDAGDAAAGGCSGWWPGAAFGACPGDGEPERSVVWSKLLPAVAAREGVAAAANAFGGAGGGGDGDGEGDGDGGAEAEAAAAALARFLAETESVAPLEGLAWVMAPPRSVPPGAVVVDALSSAAAAAVQADELGVVVEEEEEEEEAPTTEAAAPTAATATAAAATAAATATATGAAAAGAAKAKGTKKKAATKK